MLTGSPKTRTKHDQNAAQMQHHIRSTYGDSTQSQGWQQWASPIVGNDQGNGAGPQIWAAVSSPLFQILTTDGFIAQVLCAISAHEYSLSGFGFVDDVNLCITVTNNDSVMVMEQMQNLSGCGWGYSMQWEGHSSLTNASGTMCTIIGKMENGCIPSQHPSIVCKCQTIMVT